MRTAQRLFDFISRCSESTDNNEGFYLQTMGYRQVAILAMYSKGLKKLAGHIQMQTYRPNVGMVSRLENLDDLKNKARKVPPSQAELHWNKQYEESEKMCVHKYWHKTCKNATVGSGCDVSFYLLYLIASKWDSGK